MPEPIRFKQMAIMAKIETAYGSDPVPTPTANAMLMQDVTLTPLEGDELTREHIRPGLGGYDSVLVNKRVKLEGDIVMIGGGAAGTIPYYSPLLRAVGWQETNTPGVDTVYKLISEGFESCTVYFNRGGSTHGVQHIMKGCRGDWSFKLSANGWLLLHVSLEGLYTAPTSVVMPSNVDYSGIMAVSALPVNNTNTPTFTVDGYAAILHEWNADGGLSFGHREKVNYEAIEINDRPGVTGSMTIEEPPIATKDFYAMAYGTPVTMQLVHGVSAGDILQFDAARVQLGSPSLTDVDGITNLQIPLKFNPSAEGDDNDLILTVK